MHWLLIIGLLSPLVNCDDKPILQELLVPKYLEENQTIRLLCGIIRGESVEFEWYKNDKKLTELIKRKIYHHDSSSELIIKSLSIDDLGDYKCLSKNKYGEDSQSVSLYYNVKPKWIKEPEDVISSLFKEVKLECKSNGYPLPVSKWIKLSDDKKTIIKEFQLSDTIKFELSKETSGYYKCRSSNSIGSIEKIIKVGYYGILLYGPSGTGKTMLAQATAKESNANFINLDMCNLISKWYGEPIKLARAVFTLAKKNKSMYYTCIYRRNRLILKETSAMMKSQFLQLWDDFADDTFNKIIVMGTTNRKSNIDKTILSRMELRFEIKLPDFNQRIEIFRKMLRSMNLDSNFSLDELAALTDSFSGRDVESICKEVNMKCLRECLLDDESENSKDLSNTIRQVNMNDFINAIESKKFN